jgi:hypothetical protein
MKTLSTRTKVFLGTLGGVVLLWVLDTFTGPGTPEPAKAGPPTERVPIAVQPNIDAEPVTAHWIFTASRPAEVDQPIDQLDRDLFMPTSTMDAAYAPEAAESSRGDADDGKPVIDARPFETRHQLQGLVVGRRSFAVIDGGVVSLGADFDGYALVEVHRDHAVFARNGVRAILTLGLPSPSSTGGYRTTRAR